MLIDLNQFKNKAIAINYKWSNTCLLLGSVHERNLYILEEQTYSNKSCEDIVAIAQKYKVKIFTNKYEPLKLVLNCQQFEESEFKDLDSFFENLRHENRFYLNEEVIISSHYQVNCLKILLKAFMNDLCRPKGSGLYFFSLKRHSTELF